MLQPFTGYPPRGRGGREGGGVERRGEREGGREIEREMETVF
jgi:hypothetical protein